ncbi:MAG: hypothetical protein CMK83_03970 [Pseudomonadales bacterium]|nr:hypothetical protein [Pseudomonadales bacterium]RLT90592.1 MAG: DUF3732 domain-containing protein [Ketobacter sp. GenoA1]RLT99690.1 MAG: DUF3732 domain-containing protein [Ketobacter sp.]HAG97245.1 hypothetical protein [Gammaproteobacteria bacterium]MBI27561.1 hypothetical protein [Pseudomonadales bacterium]
MNMKIRKLIVWPKDSAFPPREVVFELNKVNVITGASRTGKSAIIPIIDYCLGSSSCSIPIDTIRDYASWYGVVVQLDQDQILIARKVPAGSDPSDEFYYQKGTTVTIPPVLADRNASIEDVKHSLNEMALLPYFSLDPDEASQNNFKARLSIRDLMGFVFQTQDIVANQNILFYKTHAHEHREKLRTWFPFILGAENVDVLKARQRLQVLERKLNRLRREFEKERAISEEWKSNIFGHLMTAVDYGLLEAEFSQSDDPARLLEVGKELVEKSPDKPRVGEAQIQASNEELIKLDAQDDDLASQIARIKKRLEEVKRLKSGFTDYGSVARKKADRLHLSKWLTDVAEHTESCPVCGEASHSNALSEINKISSVLKEYEDEASKFQVIPTTFDREELRLKQDLEDVIEKRGALQERYDRIVQKDEQARNGFYRNKEMYIFLGHFRSSLERFEKLVEGGDLENQIQLLQQEYDQLKPLVNEGAISRRIASATDKIDELMLSYLQHLDVEEKYRQSRPKIDIKELTIKVRGNEGDWHFLAEVGSASNWVSFHIAAMCAFQEFFASLPGSSVPSFVIFDQPSQVYFPKIPLVEGSEKEEDFKSYKDEDFYAVKKIFKTLSESYSKPGSSWQFIVLDHADKAIYGDIINIHEVDEWREGKKLIPPEWYTDLESA